MKKSLSYKEALEYLYGLQKYGIKFGLSKTSNLLKGFGNPHRGQRYIHIAGTNGKGSVAAMLESILMESGLKVALYSSPHLVRFTERFRINRVEISPDEVADLTTALREKIDPAHPPTFFEVTTAMALIHFARKGCDLAIMEVGMGGRLDATNVIRPLVSVITNISLDHQFYLGRRIMDIAGEKAGIIKRGVDLVTAERQPSVLRFFQSVCDEKKTRLWRVGRDMKYRTNGAGLHYLGVKRNLKGMELGMKGRFQHRNAATALAVVELLDRKGFSISSEDITGGLKHPYWPGRLQVFSERPLIVLDGGHNPGAVRVLAADVPREFRYRRLIIVLGIMKDKDIGGIVRAVGPIADYLIYSRPDYYRAAAPEEIREAARSLGKRGEIAHTLKAAIARAKEIAGLKDMILICGSLFTVGEAMTCLDPERYGSDELRW
ncbi:MAG: bifunctional folylpolyglutamate synthase/dihydrofolate synthase [Deltaproteobacteria bacterium HGW-Deltaproteobacteria-15]|jgi:dihydrofolate synthase/folylpolyglutamate synthase|nr:MAG: bifunctional folylpolyglutamate synthase/dihydrofolate synthase [Deltaproteobacteria bacterium HGW-Deltaproteobacteria-15]